MPTIFELLTHTSAYGSYGNEAEARQDVVEAVDNFRLTAKPPYMYSYSSLGVKLLQLAEESVYATEKEALFEDFLKNELGLSSTELSTKGAKSTLEDMLKYCETILNPPKEYFNLAVTPLVEVNMEKEIAFLWDIDENGSICASGSCDEGASCIIINRESGTVLVILSNYPNDKYGSINDIASALINEMTEAGI